MYSTHLDARLQSQLATLSPLTVRRPVVLSLAINGCMTLSLHTGLTRSLNARTKVHAAGTSPSRGKAFTQFVSDAFHLTASASTLAEESTSGGTKTVVVGWFAFLPF